MIYKTTRINTYVLIKKAVLQKLSNFENVSKNQMKKLSRQKRLR